MGRNKLQITNVICWFIYFRICRWLHDLKVIFCFWHQRYHIFIPASPNRRSETLSLLDLLAKIMFSICSFQLNIWNAPLLRGLYIKLIFATGPWNRSIPILNIMTPIGVVNEHHVGVVFSYWIQEGVVLTPNGVNYWHCIKC